MATTTARRCKTCQGLCTLPMTGDGRHPPCPRCKGTGTEPSARPAPKRPQNAAAFVALARKGASEVLREYLRDEAWGPWLKGCIFNVFHDGSTAYERCVRPSAVLHAELTAENTSAEETLARGLLKSAVVCDYIDDTYLGEYGGPINSVFYCGLGDVTGYYEGPDEATALGKFLDSLFPVQDGAR